MTEPAAGWTSLGLTVQLPQGTPAVWTALRQQWATPDLPAGGTPLHVTAGPQPERDGKAQAPVSLLVSDVQVSVQVAGDTLWIGRHLHLDLRGETFRLTVSDPEAVTGAEWLLALAEAQRATGWVPLHAATAARGARAVSVCGVSGAGKSTAALRLAGEGWAVLAEDQSWVHPATRRVTGLDQHLRAFADSVERFAPHLLASSRGTDAHGKQLLPLPREVPFAQLGSVLAFGLPPQPDRAQAVRALWESAGVPLTARARQVTMQALSTLARQVTVSGTDREGVLPQVRALLS